MSGEVGGAPGEQIVDCEPVGDYALIGGEVDHRLQRLPVGRDTERVWVADDLGERERGLVERLERNVTQEV